MREPYTYSMPEEFMQDASVPAHWRLWGILNGFFINGKVVYASNKWFAEKLGCGERTITDAVATLERLGKITCERTRTSRVIKGSNQLLGGSQPTAISDSNQLLSNSDNNSDNIPSRAELEGIYEEIIPDTESRVKSDPPRKVTPEMKSVFEVFSDQPAKPLWGRMVIEREAAAALCKAYPLDELKRRYAIVRKHRGASFCPEINKPSQLLNRMADMERFLKSL